MFQSQNVAISLRSMLAKKVIIFLIVDRRTFSDYFQLALLNAERNHRQCLLSLPQQLKKKYFEGCRHPLFDLAIKMSSFLKKSKSMNDY